MFEKPDDLRRMIGESIVSVIRQARDRGYGMVQADIRRAIGCRS